MKKYLELYEYYKEQIESGTLRQGMPVPSIRKCASLTGYSKTTVENAYFALAADGYILSTERSGYYVSYSGRSSSISVPDVTGVSKDKKPLFDLQSGDADLSSFDVALWHRYINSALRQKERLCSYGDVQGEPDLRAAIADYIREKRNVLASPEQIVVGAGVQALMNILCPLLLERPDDPFSASETTVSFPDASFCQGMQTFRGYGFDVHTRDKNAQIIYVSPSHMTRFGDVMPVSRRMELVEYSRRTGALVIEDDYDNDFLYASRPTPALYTLAPAGNVIYVSSFANVLTPGIHITFMVLPAPLAELFRENTDRFAQTASKTEQIALCGYIRDGRMASQIRRIRRHATAKVQHFYKELCTALKDSSVNDKDILCCEVGENGLQIKLTVCFKGSLDSFEKNNVSVFVNKYEDGILDLCLLPSAVESEKIKDAVCAVVSSLA